eukprot:s384_g25.t2
MGGSTSKIKTGSAHRDRIVLFGDSLTQQSFTPQGWGAAIADAYQRRADVLNRGYSGYTSRWCLEMLRHGGGIMADAGPDDTTRLVTIFLGANDASIEDQNPGQHVPLEEYKSNLREIVVITRERAPHAKILLIAPPPVCHAQRLQYQKERFKEEATGRLERTNENAGLYADAVEHVAADMSLPCLNLWKEIRDPVVPGSPLTALGGRTSTTPVLPSPSKHPERDRLAF